MISKRYLVAATLTLVLTSSALAAGKYSKQYDICMGGPDVSNGITSAMRSCTAKEIKHQDKRLNSAYKALKKNLSKNRQKELLSAQRLWIKYRDANCNFYNDPNGGTMHRLFALDCVMDTTHLRADELKSMLNIF